MCRQDQTLLSHPCFTSNICENDVPSKITFVQGFDDEPGSNVMPFQSPYFELEHSDNQKAYGFGCMADDTTDKMNFRLYRRDAPFLSVKSTRSKFHDIPFL